MVAVRSSPILSAMDLTERQQTVLGLVVERYLDDGQPVGSRAISESLTWGPSTIRAELAGLEDLGLLDHPHTSAGRVPTEAGYRFFVDRVIRRRDPSPRAAGLDIVQRELDEALREASEQLAEATQLLAIVTAPPLATSTVRRVELLDLQPRLLMIVVITSSGGISKRFLNLAQPLDPGLLDWAGAFLNERLVGIGFGARTLRARLDDPSLGARERSFLDLVSPIFAELADDAGESLFVDGATRLVEDDRFASDDGLGGVVAMLERRVELLAALRAAIPEPDVLVRIGAENESPSMRSMAMVAAGYGPVRGSVGTVSVLGPMRMDYARAIAAVREASAGLSRVVEDVYETG